MKICWQDKVTNKEVLDRAGSTSIDSMILKMQLRWSGHVIRMEPQRMPKQVFFGELAVGSRHQGRPKKRFKDNLKSHLKWADLNPKQLELAASDRASWRAWTNKAATAFEEDSHDHLAAVREHRHRAAAAPAPTTDEPCPLCNRLCHITYIYIYIYIYIYVKVIFLRKKNLNNCFLF